MFDGGLVMSIPVLNYPARAFDFWDARYPSPSRRKSIPVLAVPPTSVMLRGNESDDLPSLKKDHGLDPASTGRESSDSLFGRNYTVGILGGVSVHSSLSFARKLVDWSSHVGESGGFPFVLCSDPVLSRELLLHERSFFPSVKNKGENFRLDQRLILENLRNKRVFLEKSGARCIVMPCQISHIWHEEVTQKCRVPFLNMAECVAMELKEAKLKPLVAGSRLRIGVLATDPILAGGFYQEKLENEGFEVVLPDRATMEHTLVPAIEASNRKDMEGARNLLRITLQVLLVRAVNSIVLASDDLRNVLPPDDPLIRKCVDPIDALARSTIKWAEAVKTGA